MPINNPYDLTISDSKKASFAKAAAIFHEEIKKEEKEREASLFRPEVSLAKGLYIILGIAAVILMGIFACIKLSGILGVQERLLVLIFFGILFLAFCIKSKSILIWSILVYQKYAPADIRLACCFEPSCSEYMKIALEKYGVLPGLGKGIKRLFRCHYPNGGRDDP